MLKLLFFPLALSLLIFAGCSDSKTADKTEASTAVGDDGDVIGGHVEQTEHLEATRDSSGGSNPALGGSTSAGDAVVIKPNKEVRFSLKFLSWNVESEGSDPETIAKQIAELGNYDVIALTEVLPQAALRFCKAVGAEYNYVLSNTGRNDRMMLIYNKKSLSFVRQFELDDINYKSRYRSPMVGHFRDMLTGKELLVMVNHLARGKEEARQIQAKKLVEWGRDQTMPVVALGDYNFDYVFDTRKGNESFRLFMKDNVWEWVEPIEMIDTNWYDNPEAPDGKDDFPGSMLDFAFVAGPAKEWTTSCKVIVREGDFPDDENTSDHRPFELIVSGK